MYRADHQPNMFTHYWREPLEPRLKFVLDPNFRSEADKADQQHQREEDAALVRKLGAGEPDPSDSGEAPRGKSKRK